MPGLKTLRGNKPKYSAYIRTYSDNKPTYSGLILIPTYSLFNIQATYSAEAIATIMETGAKSVTLKKEVRFRFVYQATTMAPIIMMIVLMKVMRNYEDFVSSNMKGKVFADNTGCVGWYR